MAAPRVLPRDEGESSRFAVFVPEREQEEESHFAIGHVLFIDIVGYSKLLLDEQRESLRELNDIVRSSRQVLRAETERRLLRLPTGDGMALVFLSSPEAPAQCAFEIDEAVRAGTRLKLRMGIHSGPVDHVADVNERANVTGAGINLAQRVMDCGDAGHILVSKHVAEDLEHSGRWRPHLHHLGEREVKHGVVLSLVNLFTPELGNPDAPSKFANANLRAVSAKHKLRRNLFLGIAALLVLVAAILAARRIGSRTSVPPIAGTVPEKSIAVLPFENLCANQETAFFTDGVQDEILTDLAKVADLKVTSRTSVMQYRNLAHRNLREIGQQLGVAHILEGSVQRIGNHIRVNAQFIDARTDAHLWAQTYDRDLADVFAIQSEIATAIAEQLQANLSERERAEIQQKPTTDLTAYDFYLRAMQSNRSRATAAGSGGVDAAKEEARLLEEALRRDPSFVAAETQLAQTYLYLYWINDGDPAAHLEAAKRAIATASKLQPDDGSVHLARAVLYYWGSRDYIPALHELELARKSLPNDSRVLFIPALIERRMGDWGKSTSHLEQVCALDPLNIIYISELIGINYPALGRYADAQRALDHARSLQPKNFALALLQANLDFAWKADLRSWHELVERNFEETIAADVANARIDLAFKERDYRKTEDLLGDKAATEFDDSGYFTPRQWKQAIAARALGDSSRATFLLRTAHDRAAAFAQADLNDGKRAMTLAQIDALLGNSDEALRESKRAIDLLPIEKDAVNGAQLLIRLAGVYAQLGQTDRALDLLGERAKQVYGPTYGSLKLDEVWDPLRKDARFVQLVASLAPK